MQSASSPEVVRPLRRAFFRLHINSASFEAFSLCQLTKDNTMQQFAFAGWPVVGCSESLLDRITRKLRTGWKKLADILSQPGVPNHDYCPC
ncbi:protease FtsH-inhibitory lysogeny factor CIII [Cronobacter sakazakii]|uniref:protease FtsH-inhibitory lysogeny factor CIII n=2 Tax=Enterobacteriaceae TaxID=543 RepID=UPI0035E3CA93